jgi:ATP-dependent Clp protease protease subunit
LVGALHTITIFDPIIYINYMNGNEFRKYAIKHKGISSIAVDAYIESSVENMTRTVIEERPMNFREIDVFSRLMADRIIFLGMPIDDYVANIVQAQLLFLDSMDARRDVQMYINSPGGSVYAGLGIYDTMQWINPDVATICTGLAASMGAVLQCAGAKGKRTALPHARIMIHQPLGGAQGQASDIEITAREIQKLKKELYEIIASHSGQTFEKVENDSDRDYWMTASEAKAYGMLDDVLIKHKPTDK